MSKSIREMGGTVRVRIEVIPPRDEARAHRYRCPSWCPKTTARPQRTLREKIFRGFWWVAGHEESAW